MQFFVLRLSNAQVCIKLALVTLASDDTQITKHFNFLRLFSDLFPEFPVFQVNDHPTSCTVTEV